jgi:hypothetical protein
VEYIALRKRIKGESQENSGNVPKKEPKQSHFNAEHAECATRTVINTEKAFNRKGAEGKRKVRKAPRGRENDQNL